MRHTFAHLLFRQRLANDVIKASLFADDVCEPFVLFYHVMCAHI